MNSSKGFGLGLSIAKQLCHINLGELNATSRVGEGSTFSFSIPVAEPLQVVPRWLKRLKIKGSCLQLIEINVDLDLKLARADEFNCFLSCLLRQNDLLFRVSPTKWLMMMAIPPSEAGHWHQRIKTEFERHNRNRPMGPLADYQTTVRGRWESAAERDSILAELRRGLQLADEYSATASALA